MAGPITIFGGTGFIGRHLVLLLVRSGEAARLALRYPDRVQMATDLAQMPELIQADVLDDVAVASAVAGTDAVVNLVGILTETSTRTYRAIHVDGARRVALAAQRHGVTRLIRISALESSLTSRRSRTGQRLREKRPSEQYFHGQQSSGRASCLARMITSSAGSSP